MMELALVENIQRSNLNPMEEAEGYMYLKINIILVNHKLQKKYQRVDPKLQIK